MTRRAPRGFTLIELMVVTSILGMLLSMLFPAVHSARMGMRRIACVNNLRNLGQATLRYVNTSKRNEYPGWRQAHQMPEAHADATDLNQRLTVVSWGVTLLPFLDRDDVYRQFLLSPFTLPPPKRSAFLEVYVCPSDYPEPRLENPCSYTANCGLPDPPLPTAIPLAGLRDIQIDQPANGVFKDLRPKFPVQTATADPVTGGRGDPFSELPNESFTTANLVDGADKTLLFSENLINPHFLGNPNEPEVQIDPNAPPVTEPSPDPNVEEDTTRIPYRTWTGILIPPLLSTSSQASTSYQEQILTPPSVGNTITQPGGPSQGIQEWLIGMVWFAQPPGTPVGGTSGTTEWSTFQHRINDWGSGGAGNLGWLGGRGGTGTTWEASWPLYLNSRPASNHHAGVNVVFCDGHTGWLRRDIFYWVYLQLMTPDGTHACPPNKAADTDFGPWYVARQYMGTFGQTPNTAPLYILEDRDYK